MRFEIYDEPKNSETVCRLKLIRTPYNDGSVTLVAVDENGVALESGSIITLNSRDGKVLRHTYCAAPIVKTDSEGRVIVKKIGE